MQFRGMQFQLVRLPEVVDLAQVMMQKAFKSLAPKKRRNRSYLSSLAEVMQWQALGPVCRKTKEAGHTSGAANQSEWMHGNVNRTKVGVACNLCA